MTEKRQKATKVKCKREESLTKQSIFVEYILLQKKAFEFCWSSLADEHNTLLKSTRRHVKLDKFVSGIPWLLDLLCKHWIASSARNFCRWVADVPPRETSPTAKSEEKRMFSQARPFKIKKASLPASNPSVKKSLLKLPTKYTVLPVSHNLQIADHTQWTSLRHDFSRKKRSITACATYELMRFDSTHL